MKYCDVKCKSRRRVETHFFLNTALFHLTVGLLRASVGVACEELSTARSTNAKQAKDLQGKEQELIHTMRSLAAGLKHAEIISSSETT